MTAPRARIMKTSVYKRDAYGRIVYVREPWMKESAPALVHAYFPQRRFLWWWRDWPGAGIGYLAFATEDEAKAFLESKGYSV